MLFKWFFVLLVIMLIGIIALWIIPEPDHSAGRPHQEFSTMMQGDISIIERGTVKWIAIGLGLCVLGVSALSTLISIRKEASYLDSIIRKKVIVGAVLYELVFIVLVVLYWDSIPFSTVNLWLGFPVATAWMLFVLATFPAYFTLYYVVSFNQWIISPSEIADFEEIVKKRRLNQDSIT